ncbi:hypothetical protein HPB47_021019 [Ixodes persulcatus]|uniref:Uncharacterized protein n=1 Tax=Ixodes persulcatus TaxID=34615 RepID=A0AC60QDN6_IXOPE|nr:hypothetical protein HPB47_021019 [Ixodes persulcatus]
MRQWLPDLAFPTDISSHLSALNTALQGKDNLISDMVSTIFPFQGKLHLGMEWENVAHFTTCQKRFPAGENQKSVTATYAPYVENLLFEFQRRFRALEVQKANYDLFRDPFSVSPEDSDPTMQLELSDLRCSPALKTMHGESQLLEFDKIFDKNKYGNLVDHA